MPHRAPPAEYQMLLPRLAHLFKARSTDDHAVLGRQRPIGIPSNSLPATDIRASLHGENAPLPAGALMPVRYVFAFAAATASSPYFVYNQRRERLPFSHFDLPSIEIGYAIRRNGASRSLIAES